MHAFQFLVDTYATERLKTLSVWATFRDEDLAFRPDPRARTPLEHMVHQCTSEDRWMREMLGIDAEQPALPAKETRLEFLQHYARASERRLARLAAMPAAWFEESVRFFDVERSRAWVLVRRFTHTSHHRGQLTAYLRMLHREVWSTYGPTADTGGLPANRATVVYRHRTVAELLEAETRGARPAPLPGPGTASPSERR